MFSLNTQAARGKGRSMMPVQRPWRKLSALWKMQVFTGRQASLAQQMQAAAAPIAKFVGHMDVDTVDLGVPILSMHAPFELASKLDVYHTYKAFKAFYAS